MDGVNRTNDAAFFVFGYRVAARQDGQRRKVVQAACAKSQIVFKSLEGGFRAVAKAALHIVQMKGILCEAFGQRARKPVMEKVEREKVRGKEQVRIFEERARGNVSKPCFVALDCKTLRSAHGCSARIELSKKRRGIG